MHDCWRPASEPSREVCSDFRSVSLLLDLQRRYKSFGLKDLSRFLWRNYRLIVFYPIFFVFDWDITSCISEVYIYIYIYIWSITVFAIYALRMMYDTEECLLVNTFHVIFHCSTFHHIPLFDTMNQALV